MANTIYNIASDSYNIVNMIDNTEDGVYFIDNSMHIFHNFTNFYGD